MPYAASCSRTADTRLALDQVCREIVTQLQGQSPDLSFIFASHAHVDSWDKIVESIQATTGSQHVLGCTGDSIAGGEHEIERGPALALWSAVLKGATIETFHVEFERTPDGPICSGLPEPPADTADVRAALLLADPYSCAIDTLSSRLCDDFPRVPLICGLGSGGTAPGEDLPMVNGAVMLSAGAVGASGGGAAA